MGVRFIPTYIMMSKREKWPRILIPNAFEESFESCIERLITNGPVAKTKSLKGSTHGPASQSRDARFFLVHDTKIGNNVPNEHKMYQMVIKNPKCP
jgi:hypothetical protein